MSHQPAAFDLSLRRELVTALLRGGLAWQIGYFILAAVFAANRTGAMWAGLVSTVFLLLLPAWLLRRGSVTAAAASFLVSANLMSFAVAFLAAGARSLAIAYQVAFTVLALLLFNRRGALANALFAILSNFGLALYEALGYPLPRYFPMPPLNHWMLGSLCFVLAGPPLWMSVVRWRWALRESESQAEDQRRAREKILYQGQLIAQAADPMIAVDARYIINFWNAAATRLLGYAEQEALGASLAKLVRLTEAGAVRKLKSHLDEHGQWNGELELVSRRHGIIPVEASIGRLFDADGKRIGSVASLRDIRERKWAENELREREARLALTFDRAPVAMCEVGFDGIFLRVNQAFTVLLGHTKDDLAGRRMLDLVHPDDREAESKVLHDVASGTQSGCHHERRLYRPDGSVIWVNSHLALVSNAAGHPLCVMATMEDISQRRVAEQERQRMQDQLIQSQKMEAMGRLAGGVAHDFNNFLTLINGYSNLMLETLRPGDVYYHHVREIAGAGERAAALVQQLLAFSRHQVQTRESLDLNEVLAGARRMLSPLLGSGVELSFTFSRGPARIEADRHQLEQVILNLAVNARDAMPRGGLLLFEIDHLAPSAACPHCARALAPAEYVRLRARDTGCGMDAATLAQVFEPFFTTKPSGQGTGLGLSTVQGIIEQSGGHICVQSQPGAGTEFFVLLPATAVPPASQAAETPAPPAGGNEIVLVVEDEPPVRELVSSVLREYGYRVREAANAEEGLGALREYPVDLLLTDIMMPGRDGAALARDAQILQPGLPVLFMSGNAQDRIDITAASNFIQKPFTPQLLAARVGEALLRAPSGARVLIVDDDEQIRDRFRQVLGQAGYRVGEAADGRKAMAWLEESSADLVITDLIMPEQEGIETIGMLRKRYPGLGIIAVTGSNWSRFLDMARALGANGVLTKPVSAEVLTAEVERVLALRR